eukprot:365084-Chlamydomonas_euryale.AAC.25
MLRRRRRQVRGAVCRFCGRAAAAACCQHLHVSCAAATQHPGVGPQQASSGESSVMDGRAYTNTESVLSEEKSVGHQQRR